MALWKRADIYYVKLTAPDGTLLRHSTGTTDRKKAQEYHDKLKAQLWDLAKLKQKPKRTWDEAALRWLQEKKHKKSYMDDVFRIRFFTRFLRGKTLDQISRDMIDGLITRHLAKTAPRTKDLYVALIRAIFRIAMREWEWIETMPAFKTYVRNEQPRVRWLTHAQAERLLAELPEHQRDMMLFALATGLRQGNIRRLTWEQVDLRRKIVMIAHGETKNGNALGVPLNELAMAVLTRRKEKYTDHVFTYRGKPINQVNTKAWKDALKRAGITNFRWHDLRHTWASWLRQNDVPTWVLQELGGWKSDTMVRRYAHMSVKHLQPFADQLIFEDTKPIGQVPEKSEGQGHKNGHTSGRPRLYVVE
ncbi:tyrosine-type recombinase/integrase [Novosphingobium profundi]|uniref:tyrosine-type recombinase/integrase n=1 Tax=Novosphingobium profundi TaxID=1774954 RepID=UPI001FE7486E|nr:site-specific integrase [Novosphingobium profundi]